MANPSVTYTLTNGTANDAGPVNTNFSDIIAALTDGTKDINVASIVGTTLNITGASTLGNLNIASNGTSTGTSLGVFANSVGNARVRQAFFAPNAQGSIGRSNVMGYFATNSEVEADVISTVTGNELGTTLVKGASPAIIFLKPEPFADQPGIGIYKLSSSSYSSIGAYIRIVRIDTSDSSEEDLGCFYFTLGFAATTSTAPAYLPTSSFTVIDTSAAGSYYYIARAAKSSGVGDTTLIIQNYRMLAYEL
jgi:hypothetical protein